MDQERPKLEVIAGGAQKVVSLATTGKAVSPERPPGLTAPREIEIWNYICEQLRTAGIEHRIFGLAGALVCNAYAEWLEARETLEEFKTRNKGSYYVKTPNGYEQPHQSFYVAEKLRRELLQYLPECCLTIPSFANVRSKLGDDGQQDLQFGDLVGHANEDRKNYSRR
ncbi:P27 family phage terminase small subunit [Achromobacter spanius]